jgi:hypothetical protein
MVNGNEPIYPVVGTNGLTKLEWFSGLAMQGLLGMDWDWDWDKVDKDVVKAHTIQSVKYANALIEELNSQQNKTSNEQ